MSLNSSKEGFNKKEIRRRNSTHSWNQWIAARSASSASSASRGWICPLFCLFTHPCAVWGNFRVSTANLGLICHCKYKRPWLQLQTQCESWVDCSDWPTRFLPISFCWHHQVGVAFPNWHCTSAQYSWQGRKLCALTLCWTMWPTSVGSPPIKLATSSVLPLLGRSAILVCVCAYTLHPG